MYVLCAYLSYGKSGARIACLKQIEKKNNFYMFSF